MTLKRDHHPNLAEADESHALDYEALSERDRRYLKLMRPDRSTIVSAVILASVIMSGLLSCGLAGAFWVLMLRLMGER